MQEQKREWTGVWIPKEVWLNKELSWMEKLFLAEINNLDNKDGCYQGNNTFSEHFGISKDRCSKIINELKKKGYINLYLTYKPNTKQVDKRIIHVVKSKFYGEDNDRYRQEQLGGVVENNDTPNVENNEVNNTLINNTINNNKKQSVVKTTDRLKKEYDVESDEYKLVDLFVKLMEKQNELFKGPKNYNTWCDSMRKILDIDLTNLSQDRKERCKIAQKIIVHSCNKHFFSKSIMSIDKLRKRLKEVWADLKGANNNSYKPNYQQQPTTPTYQVSQFQGLTLD